LNIQTRPAIDPFLISLISFDFSAEEIEDLPGFLAALISV